MTSPRKSSRSEMRSLEDEHASLKQAFADLEVRFMRLSMAIAQRDYGHDRVNAAMEALISAPREVQWGITREDHPFDAAVAWHRAWGMH